MGRSGSGRRTPAERPVQAAVMGCGARTRLLAALCAALSLLAPTLAAAQDATVVVLGLRSIEGDDLVASTLTDALRASAATVGGWDVQQRGPTMAQMSMAHGCDEMDVRCLADIAAGLDVQQIVYGTVRRTSTRDAYDYVLHLSLFDATEGSIKNSMTESVARADVDNGTVSGRAADLIAGLTGQQTSQAHGSVRVSLNVAQPATFFIDGDVAGESRSGSFAQEGVGEGVHTLSVEAEGYQAFETSFEVAAGAPTRVAVNLLPVEETPDAPAQGDGYFAEDYDTDGAKPDSTRRWVSYGLLGTSGLSLIGMGASWLIVGGINDDDEFRAYSNAVYQGNLGKQPGEPLADDVCDEALSGSPYPSSGTKLSDIQDMCKRGRTFEILQWVFLGSAVVTGGVGGYLLLTDGDGSSARNDGPQFSFRPRFGVGRAHIDARVSF